jgi:hypothetical protein
LYYKYTDLDKCKFWLKLVGDWLGRLSNAYKTLVGEPEGKILLGSPMHRERITLFLIG